MVRGCLNGSEAYDLNFVATFDTTSCPDEIKLVTHITTPDTTLLVHHHRHFQRVPCFSCYSPYHSSAKCAARRGDFLFEHHREFICTHQITNAVSVLTFQHITVLERLQHVAGQEETLQATTTKLKDDACKRPLLAKISHSSSRDGPREANPPSSFRNQPAATRAAGPTTDEWFDVGTNKKKRVSRLNAASATPTAASSTTPLRRPRSKAVEGTSKALIQGSVTSAKPSVTKLVNGPRT